METIRSHKNILTEKIDSIDYTHLLGYPSEVVAAEVITLVKEVVSDHMDKIVGQLEDIKMRHFLTMANTGDDNLDFAYEYVGNALDTAIEIVKGGTV